jgi:hypothetical protein
MRDRLLGVKLMRGIYSNGDRATMVGDQAWWMVRRANRRTAMVDLRTAEPGVSLRRRGVGRHANASACLRIGALVLVILAGSSLKLPYGVM